MEINTHQRIDTGLCGAPVEVGMGESQVTFTAKQQMAVDDLGLTHGGFIFGMADHAAMIAVNHPNVVLGAADVRFLKPVQTGQTMIAFAKVISEKGKKREVEVTVKRGEEPVFSGSFTCFVLETHVLGG